MRLNKEVKDRIDKYFEEISPEDLYQISVTKYEFTEKIGMEIFYQNLGVLKVDLYKSSSDESYDCENKQSVIALAA